MAQPLKNAPSLLAVLLVVAAAPVRLWAAAAAPCVADGQTLCIDDLAGDQRYQVRITYKTAQAGGLAGSGHAVSLAPSGLTRAGAFWFFSSDNPEVLVKLLDGCAVNQHHWVLAAATTNVGFDLVVTDSLTGESKTYANADESPAAPIQDVGAFSCADPCGNPDLATRIEGFTASPANQTTGGTETLSWQLAGAGPWVQSLTGTELAGVALRPADRVYELAVASAGPHSATLTAAGRCGTATATATYDVEQACLPPHVVSFTSGYQSLCAGQSTPLTWQTSGSGDVSISPGIGAVPGNGSVSVPVNATTTYTLTKTAPCGADSAMATVQVLQGPTIVSFTADSTTIPVGGSTTLRFDIEGTIYFWSISDTLGNVPPMINRYEEGSLTTTYYGRYAGTDTLNLSLQTSMCQPFSVESGPLTITVQ